MVTSSFFLGNPTEPSAKYLGYLKSDGNPEAMPPSINTIRNEEDFLKVVDELKHRKEFSDNRPENPTSYVYAYFNNKVFVCFHGSDFFEWSHVIANPDTFANVIPRKKK